MYIRLITKYSYISEILRFTKHVANTPIIQVKQFNKQFMESFKPIPITIDLNGFYKYIITDIINGDLESANQVASHYFTKQGKLVRPLLNLLLYELIDTQQKCIADQKTWAAVIEILHVASLVHDDILDNSDKRRGLDTVHQVFGKKQATFSANYLIGRAGRRIAEFDNIQLFRIYSQIMENLTNGEYLQALKQSGFSDYDTAMRTYMIKTYYKTATLIANSLRGVCTINNTEIYSDGMAFQLIDDVLDYTSESAELGKSNLSDLKSGVVTGPVLFEFFKQKQLGGDDYKIMDSMLNGGQMSSCDEVNQIVMHGDGITMSKYLAYQHAQQAIQLIHSINKQNCDGILSLVYMILSRNK